MTFFSSSKQLVKAILFDCDGTLVDSEEAHLAAWGKTLQDRGHLLTRERSVLYAGKADFIIARQVAEDIGCAQDVDAILFEKRVHYQKLHEKGLPPMEGTVEFVKRLAKEKSERNLKLGVASAAIKSEIVSHLQNLGIKEAFDLILSGEEDLHDYFDPEGVNKPKPYIYLHAAKLLQVLPAECVVIEDSQTGVRSGRAAGCITVAIPNRFTALQDLSAAHFQLQTLADMSIDAFLRMSMGA